MGIMGYWKEKLRKTYLFELYEDYVEISNKSYSYEGEDLILDKIFYK